MRLATFLVPGSDAPQAGEVRGDAVVAFADAGTVLDRLASGDRAPAGGEEYALSAVTLLAPVPRPRAIFCVGLNYAAHAAETGSEPPPAPIIFMKLPSSATAPGGEVVVPVAAQRRLDYEGELVAVIGADGAVAGYAVADDLSARDLQGREPQWTRAKGFDNSCPYGPWITTADEVPDPHSLTLRTWVNGDLRQDSSTSDLIFDVPHIVEFLSQTCTLEPGDLILTGTPAGVGMGRKPPSYLQPGDVVRIEIEPLGAIEHRIA
ncbi:fumarylacetoacetate hydrolase family protein [Baekduia soli]|uniref:Fumarylacetoacetate hydrolase family protein n=1 Tax=Baekduia soli TaxID=496014 RepID=A0A5B8UCS3_9ACTN|nr:fumarylacetoacetate hydrolase family protein [Baekduia soli]QEC50471.1 fumarylacetoacetate hydrolase family protein [Baekduia soli]